MATRRTASTSCDKSSRCSSRNQRIRNNAGITRSLLIMVDSATEATITMPVAAENPPMKASRATPLSPYASGSVSTQASAAPSRTTGMCVPAATMGSTAMLMMAR